MSDHIIKIVHPVRGTANCAPHQFDEFAALGWKRADHIEPQAPVADATTAPADAPAEQRTNPKRADARSRARTGKD